MFRTGQHHLARLAHDDSTHPCSGADVSIISHALGTPTTRGRRCVPPKPGMMPSCNSGRPILAQGVPTRALQAKETSQPPPRHNPLRCAPGR